MNSVVSDQTPTLIEVAFFSLPSEDIEGLNSYASIPEDAYVDLWRCPSISVLRRLAVLLRCDPAHAFVPVRTLSETTACVLHAGPEFERALQNRTTDELSRAGAEWAKEPGWSELHANPMDLSGAVLFLAGHWVVASERGYPLWAWVDSLGPTSA